MLMMDLLGYKRDASKAFNNFGNQYKEGWMVSAPYCFTLVNQLGLRHNSYNSTTTNADVGITKIWESATLGTANTSGQYSAHPNPFCLAHPSGDDRLFNLDNHGGEVVVLRRHKAPRPLLVRSVTVKSWAPTCEIRYATAGSANLDVNFEIWVTIEDGLNTNSKVSQNNSVTNVGSGANGVYLWDTIHSSNGGLQPANNTMPWQSVPDDVWDGTETNRSRLISKVTLSIPPGRHTLRCPYLEGLIWSWPSTSNTSSGDQANQVVFNLTANLGSSVEKPLFCPAGMCVGVHFVERVEKSDMHSGSTLEIGHHSTGGYTSGILGYKSSSVPYESVVLAEINMR